MGSEAFRGQRGIATYVHTALQVNPEFFMFSPISLSNVYGLLILMAYFEGLMNPKNQPLMHINLDEPFGHRSLPKRSPIKTKVSKIQKVWKCFAQYLSQMSMDLSFLYIGLKGLSCRLKYCRLKSVDVWQQGGHRSVGHLAATHLCPIVVKLLDHDWAESRQRKDIFSQG